MSRTALNMTVQEQRAFHPGALTASQPDAGRWDRAWQVARAAAQVLRQQFGATRVVGFGSLTNRAWFTRWSDIDLAAWGIPPESFYRAVAVVTGLSAEFKIDLVAPEDCAPSLNQAIEREGVDL
jgi:predicted nucleotidyltransferase